MKSAMDTNVIHKLFLSISIELILFDFSGATFFGFQKKIDFDSGFGMKGKWDEKVDLDQLGSMFGLPDIDEQNLQKFNVDSENIGTTLGKSMNFDMPKSDGKKAVSVDNERTEISKDVVNGSSQPKISVTVTQNSTQMSKANSPSEVDISMRSSSLNDTRTSKTAVERRENSIVQTKNLGSSDIRSGVYSQTNTMKKSERDDTMARDEPQNGGTKLEFDIGFGDFNKHFKLI
ncbi:hypothetical protein QAD02_015412 [Eretmocerus hayati]|uniref:Uncharacterized protein n=1 Tax=Eretmocerus hayati TaxID=131215 RepID=A0ACC2P885_9HYME|nr:hypothetical protein QAD02_015412 [Eretmocerus hayati]